MINVDPDLGASDVGQAIVAEPLPGRGVEREHDVKIFRFVRRERNQLAAREERKLLEQPFFVPDFYLLAELLQCEAHRDLAAEGVSIRADVAEDDKTLVSAQDFRNFREARVR